LQLQQQLWQAGFDSTCSDGISVARPIGAIPEWNLWLQEHVAGVDGWEALTGPEAIRCAELAAKSLAKLHRAEITIQKSHSFTDERQLIDSRLTEAIELAPQFAQPIAELRRHCLRVCDSQLESEQVVLHRDFYPDQLLFTDQGVVLLDLDLVCRGPASIDIGNFTGHLVELGIRKYGNPEHFAGVERAFVDSYFRESRVDLRRTAHQCKLLTLARHVYISQSREDRRSSTAGILAHCAELIAQEW
jgi:thiamine kinase-like enzyme